MLERLEDVVAQGRSAVLGGRGVATAWAAVEADWQDERPLACPPCTSEAYGGMGCAYGGFDPWAAWMAAAASSAQAPRTPATGPSARAGMECWRCGRRGHVQQNCPGARAQQQNGAGKMDAILSVLDNLTAELRASRAGAPAAGPKKG